MAGISPILPANVNGQKFLKIDDSNRALVISVPQR
jgi:hypothetical protein